MTQRLMEIYEHLKKQGLTEEQQKDIEREIESSGIHELPHFLSSVDGIPADSYLSVVNAIYRPDDMVRMQNIFTNTNSVHVIKSLDELLRRDERREEDGFPKKIRLGKIIKPSDHGKNKVVVVPTVVEEKLIHDTRPITGESETGGAGEGKEGDILGEEPIHSTQEGAGTGSGEGGETFHEIESTAYDLGKILTEQFQLPNLKEKGKRRSLTKYTYDLTDMNRGFGQVLDKKATLRRIIETNLALENIPDVQNIDPDKLLVSPSDKVYRTLSKERDYESQAVVFFVRDYSGSMSGKPTELVVSQHLLIFTWLMYQYEGNVETRFILHDTAAKEVEDFYTYYNTSVAGGTKLSAAYKLVNEIVEKESLVTDYNIYVFQGTDGEDWETDGKDAMEELKKITEYANRVGVTVAENNYKAHGGSVVEKYFKKSGILEKKKLVRLDSMRADSNQERIIEGIKKLVSEE
ncbi:MAG: DUF444 family protein [bacterium]|nr:DUF444 family protein [bacterium]